VLYGVSLPEAHDPIDEELGNIGIDFGDGSPARAAKLQVLQGFNELCCSPRTTGHGQGLP
jgi:hypothetical protein